MTLPRYSFFSFIADTTTECRGASMKGLRLWKCLFLRRGNGAFESVSELFGPKLRHPRSFRYFQVARRIPEIFPRSGNPRRPPRNQRSKASFKHPPQTVLVRFRRPVEARKRAAYASNAASVSIVALHCLNKTVQRTDINHALSPAAVP